MSFATLQRLGYEVRQYKRGLPTVASFDITERCDLHCKMCRFWVDGDHDADRELRGDEICSLIDELIDDLGVRRIRLLGGEPFLRPDALDIVRHAKGRGIHVNVVTEGSRIDEAIAEGIVTSGLDSIRFSIDGIGSRHDLVRGKRGAFEQVSRALCLVRDARARLGSATPEIQVFAVISTLNHDQVLPLHDACRGELAPARLLFGPVWEATPEEVEASVWQGKQLADRHHLPIGRSLKLSGEEAQVFKEHAAATREERSYGSWAARVARLAHPLLRREICPETNSLHVDPFGRVKFCSVYMNYAYGKYPESSVRDIWFSRQHGEFHRDLAKGFLPLCRTVCGPVDDYYAGAPRQLLRSLLLRLAPSPLRGTRGARAFTRQVPDEVIDPAPLARGLHPWKRKGATAARERSPVTAAEPEPVWPQRPGSSTSEPGRPNGARRAPPSTPFSSQ